MKTNKEFNALSVEEQVEYFTALTEAEVNELTKDQRAAYDEWANGGIEEEESAEDKVAQYVKDHPEYTYDEIILTSDGIFFPGTLKGDNSAANHCGVTKTFATYKTK